MCLLFRFGSLPKLLRSLLYFRGLGRLQGTGKFWLDPSVQQFLRLWEIWREFLASEPYPVFMDSDGTEISYDDMRSNLSERLCALLWESGYRKPLMLDAAFDDEPEALNLIDSLEGIFETGVVKGEWAAELMRWKLHQASGLRRVRSRIATAPCDERVLVVRKALSIPVPPPSSSAVLAATVRRAFCKTTHWRTRLGARLANTEDAKERAVLETREREKWVLQNIQILKSAEVPVCAQGSFFRC